MLSYIREEDEAKKARNDVFNWIKGQNVFREKARLERFMKLVDEYGSRQYAAGYANAEFDQAERED